MDVEAGEQPPSAPPRAHRWLRRVRMVLSVIGWLVTMALFLPVGFGGQVSWVVVSGRSMEPTYHTYDLALVVRAGTPNVGDVIVYRVPAGEPGAGRQVIHRVIGGDPINGYTTKGDNREGPDIWHPRRHDVIGRVVAIVPQGGKAIARVFDIHNLGLVAIGLLVWALWPRNRGCDEDDGGPDQDGSLRASTNHGHEPEPVADRADAEGDLVAV